MLLIAVRASSNDDREDDCVKSLELCLPGSCPASMREGRFPFLLRHDGGAADFRANCASLVEARYQTFHRPSEGERIFCPEYLDVHHKSPDSGERRYKSRT